MKKQAELEKLLKRQQELTGELETVHGEIEAVRVLVSSQVLEGGDSQQAGDRLRRLELRSETIEGALKLAGEKIARLKDEIHQAEREKASMELSGIDSLAAEQFMDVLTSLYNTFDLLDKYSETVRNGKVIISQWQFIPGDGVKLYTFDYVIRTDIDTLLRKIEKAEPELCETARNGRPIERKRQAVLPPLLGTRQELA